VLWWGGGGGGGGAGGGGGGGGDHTQRTAYVLFVRSKLLEICNARLHRFSLVISSSVLCYYSRNSNFFYTLQTDVNTTSTRLEDNVGFRLNSLTNRPEEPDEI